jgi:drug/metabolite transporter (DMT)-like permease
MEFLWCITVTTCIGIGFKLFSRFKINTFNAIVINYTVCLVLGTLIDPASGWPFSSPIIQSPWFSFDIILGLMFIVGFNLTAKSIQQAGITMTTLIQRMSLILTVSFTVILFKEHFGWLELCGLVLALLAIIAINQKTSSLSFQMSGPFPFILLAVLVISAAIEILLYYVEKTGLVGSDQMAFTTHGFGCAAIFGWVSLIWLWLKKKLKFSRRDVIAGILLGIPNFFSIFLLLKMLNNGWNGSLMYPLVNVSVLLLSTLVAVIAFREKLNRLNWIGIGLASAAILVIAYAHTLSN